MNGSQESKVPCDAGKTCLCFKPAAEHPNHPRVLTLATTQKLTALRIMSSLRDPDGFGMYTYNDHLGYGVLEVAQNLVLDFEEAKTWRSGPSARVRPCSSRKVTRIHCSSALLSIQYRLLVLI